MSDKHRIEAVAQLLAAKRGIRWKTLDEQGKALWRRDAQHAIEAVEEAGA